MRGIHWGASTIRPKLSAIIASATHYKDPQTTEAATYTYHARAPLQEAAPERSWASQLSVSPGLLPRPPPWHG